jgi:predicted NAD/FAD-binding protein
MQIAVIGSGISGLVTAYRLQTEHEITVFEANDYLGGHTNTIDVEVGGEQQAIDTGFIVFNHRTYPNFTRLLDELQVESKPTSMTFSFRCDRTGLEYRGADPNGLFAQRSNLLSWRFHRMLFDLLRFNRQAQRLLDRLDDTMTVGDFFEQHHFSREFIEYYFLPMGSAIWSCPRGTIEQFPMRFILEFYRNHGLLSVRDRPQWRVIVGGSRQYVAALMRQFQGSVRVNCPVRSVIRKEDAVEVRTSGCSSRFDHVVFACHSDEALRMLGAGATPAELEILSAFPYELNVAVLHTDPSVLPRCRRAWASWNFRSHDDEHRDKATVTYNMNILQGLHSRKLFCVTLNDEASIAPESVLRRMIYHHPVFTSARTAAQLRHSELINQNRTSFCGAYWGNGFHEDGVNSALAVCRGIGGQSELDRTDFADAGRQPAWRE